MSGPHGETIGEMPKYKPPTMNVSLDKDTIKGITEPIDAIAGNSLQRLIEIMSDIKETMQSVRNIMLRLETK